MFFGQHTKAFVTDKPTKNRNDKNHRQGEIRDILGPLNRDGKPFAKLRRTVQMTTCGTFQEMRYIRSSSRRRPSEKVTQRRSTASVCTTYENAIKEGGSIKTEDDKQCTAHPRQPPGLRIRVHTARLASVGSLTRTRSTL